jgi:uncharacterized repeat protein (TIGR04076 family)
MDLSAGPLPALGLLLAYLAYGFVLDAVHGPVGDQLLGPDTPDERLLLSRTTGWTAGGIVGGMLVGAFVGLLMGPPEAVLTQGAVQAAAFGLPPAAVVLALTLVGGAVGLQLGSVAGLSAPTAGAAVPAVDRAPTQRAAAIAPAYAPGLATGNGVVHLRAVSANGVCLRGYKPGDLFAAAANGELRPTLCPEAAEALRPMVAAMARGEADAPSAIACPIVEHMLVFELARAA